jgi:superfamily II DNA/RNA helicase
VLCFVRTKHGASRLARQLEKDGLKTTAIHGDKSQIARLEALDEFKAAKVQVMVATDVAGRGLDIDDVPLVVNYEIPHVPEDYIHRVGRTGRAGAAGEAVSFCAPDEERLLAEIERLLKRSIPVVTAEGIVAGRRPVRDAREARPPKQLHDRAATHARHLPRAEPVDRNPDQRHIARPEAVDRNPDQPPRSQALHRPAPAALTAAASAPGRHWNKKTAPVPALLMKRRVAEPESA